MARRLLVIGAGPIGLAAAVAGLERGLDVTVLERDAVGASMLRWGATRFFSPFWMNVSGSFREALGESCPAPEELLTGPEFVTRVLRPIAEGPLARRVRTGHRVVAVGRANLIRGEFPGTPIRAERAFRVLVDGPDGEETFEAESVLDASGVYGQPCSFGAGGLPARGERSLGPAVVRHLEGVDPERLRGKRVLLVGHGHSAANALLALAGADVSVVWIVRTASRYPCVEVPNDSLPERARIASGANVLAAEPPPWLSVHRRTLVDSVERRDGKIHATLTTGRTAVVDEVLGFTGYRPDLSILSELAIEVSPVTEGTARLSAALAKITDGLALPALPVEALESGEPGFALAGNKSWGRSPGFLLRTGLEHVNTLLRQIAP